MMRFLIKNTEKPLAKFSFEMYNIYIKRILLK